MMPSLAEIFSNVLSILMGITWKLQLIHLEKFPSEALFFSNHYAHYTLLHHCPHPTDTLSDLNVKGCFKHLPDLHSTGRIPNLRASELQLICKTWTIWQFKREG